MSEMVERVARALVAKRVALEIEADGFAVPTNPAFYAHVSVDEADRAEARAAIEAMRTPTDEMIAAVDATNFEAEQRMHCDEAWVAMVDAALQGA